jgi:hypothetical protein
MDTYRSGQHQVCQTCRLVRMMVRSLKQHKPWRILVLWALGVAVWKNLECGWCLASATPAWAGTAPLDH